MHDRFHRSSRPTSIRPLLTTYNFAFFRFDFGYYLCHTRKPIHFNHTIYNHVIFFLVLHGKRQKSYINWIIIGRNSCENSNETTIKDYRKYVQLRTWLIWKYCDRFCFQAFIQSFISIHKTDLCFFASTCTLVWTVVGLLCQFSFNVCDFLSSFVSISK